MAFADLRQYMSKLEEEGELQRIEQEVDWDLELGAVIRRSYDLRAPAPFFQKIKGYPEGYRVFGAPAGLSSKSGRPFVRIAIAMGMAPQSTPIDLMEEYIKRRKNLIKPMVVSTGPCKEEIHIGDEVDLEEFPAPFVHEGDGGRYIGTWHMVVTKDPDTGWVNWGMYRLMLVDKRSMSGIVIPTSHIGGMYYQKYEARNLPMEFAVAIGTEPATPIISASHVPTGVDEADVIGGVRREPLELVKCETVDLYVPATSEIVLEGVILPHERVQEGPFGEFTGYRSSSVGYPQPVYRVKAVTHRKNPILPVSCMGVPVDDSAATMHIRLNADLLEMLRERGFPVKTVYLPLECVNTMVVVSTKTPYPNFAKRIAHAIWSSSAGTRMNYVIVVDEDVDATNMSEVLHALVTRCHPDRGIQKVTNAPVLAFVLTFLDPEDRELGNNGAYALFDCTWPKHWRKEDIPVKASFDVLWPKEIQEMVLRNWDGYGYKADGPKRLD